MIDDRDRLVDLARYCRGTLLDDGLITLEEFQLLTRTREAEGREIESFDALKKRLESKKGK